MGRKDKPVIYTGNDRLLLGAKMRLARQAMGISLSQMAELSEYSRSFLSGIENNFVKPSQAVVAFYEQHLQCQPGELMTLWQETYVIEKKEGTVPYTAQERKNYLLALLDAYEDIALPADPAKQYHLDDIYQPLRLQRDPLTAESWSRSSIRASASDDGQSPPDGAPEDAIVIAASSSEMLQKSLSRHIVILGGPGVGKTTLLKRLINEQAHIAMEDPQALLPIFLSLADLKGAGKSDNLQDCLLTAVKWQEYRALIAQALDHGTVFICLDDLEEVATKIRPRIIDWITTNANRSQGVWVVGSRLTEYQGHQFAPGNFVEWGMLPMDDQARRCLAQALLPLLGGRQPTKASAGFITAIKHHAQASTWGENPLLFSLALSIYARQGTLPLSRAELYHEVIDAIMALREPDGDLRAETKRTLAEFTLRLYQTQCHTFTRTELREHLPRVSTVLGEHWSAPEMVKRIIHSGIFEAVANETYTFRHPTFQEYFVATALAYWLTNQEKARFAEMWQLIHEKQSDTRWSEVLRLMVGILIQERGNEGWRMARQWLYELVSTHHTLQNSADYQVFVLVLRSLSEFPELFDHPGSLSITTARQLLVEWASALIHAGRDEESTVLERFVALGYELSALPPAIVTSAIHILEEALRDTNARVRMIAATTLGQLGEHAPVATLVQALADCDPTVRRIAVTALGKQGAQAPIERLVQMLDDHEVRYAAIGALGQLGAQMPVEVLVPILRDEDAHMRRAAAIALGRAGPCAPVAPLIAALSDEDELVRYAAIESLGWLGTRAPVGALVQALTDTNELVRYAAVEALRRLGEAGPLMTAAEDGNEHVRYAAQKALEYLVH